jgi:adenosylcobinamide-phosphate synthase
LGFLSLLIAFLIEQAKPLPLNNPVYSAIVKSAQLADGFLHAGDKSIYGYTAWFLVVGAWSLSVQLLWCLSLWIAGPLGGCISILVLYFTLGFRQFSHYFTDIQISLNQADIERARQLLQQWKTQTDPEYSAEKLSKSDIVKQAIEHALLSSHRHVFAVMFWYLLLPGPIGAVLYRVSDYLSRKWNDGEHTGSVLGRVAERIQQWLDWLPARLTALSFAAAGNFEEAMLVWRSQAAQDRARSRGVLLSAGLGALGLRPSYPSKVGADTNYVTAVIVDSSTLAAAVGLVWRAVVLWMGVLLLITVAGLVR